MPAIIIERPECKEEMWKALKHHIVRIRQKKKEELEEEEAEENRRKQREEQYQKERMTLGETRKQITSLERHLDKLRDEKHQLFLQLKKVLNEENAMRKRRFEEMSKQYPIVPLATGSGGNAGHQQQVFIHNVVQTPLPPRHQHKVGHAPGQLMTASEVAEDSHRGLGEYGGRAVLWNKSQTYSTTGAAGFYPGHHPGPIYSIMPPHLPSAAPPASAQGPPPSTLASSMASAMASGMAPGMAPGMAAGLVSTMASGLSISLPEREREREREQREREREQREQRERDRDREREREREREQREREREREEPPVIKIQYPPRHPINYQDKFPVRPSSHVPIHGGIIPIQQTSQGAKTGSITSGYPVRSPAPMPQSQHASPHASPQPPPRPTTFQPAGPIIPQQVVCVSFKLR